jgi:hypothetical protein
MRTRVLKVLLVEDNAGDARLLREMFTTERPGSIEFDAFDEVGRSISASCERPLLASRQTIADAS